MDSLNGFSVDSSLSRYTDYIDELAQDLESRYWENKPPEHWTSEDVWHWIFSWAGDRSVDVEEVQPLAYSNMTGLQLIQMSKNDFVNLNPKYGGHIFETLQSLSNQFRDFRSNSISSASSGSSSPPASSPSSSSSHHHHTMNNPSGVRGCSNGNGNFFSAALPSFDLLRSSCLDLEGQGSSPESGKNLTFSAWYYIVLFLTFLTASDSDRESTSYIINSHLVSMHPSATSSHHHMVSQGSTGSPSSIMSSSSALPSSPLASHHMLDSHPSHYQTNLQHHNPHMFNSMQMHPSNKLGGAINSNVITLLNSSSPVPLNGGLMGDSAGKFCRLTYLAYTDIFTFQGSFQWRKLDGEVVLRRRMQSLGIDRVSYL